MKDIWMNERRVGTTDWVLRAMANCQSYSLGCYVAARKGEGRKRKRERRTY